MKVGRTFLSGVCVICCALVLLSGLNTQVFGKTPVAPKTSAEPNTPSPTPGPNVPAGPNESNDLPAKIVFEQTVHDFGPIAPSSSNTCEFKFQNKGTGTLKISEVTKTCGCTVSKLEKNDYAPGESGEIGVTYNTDASVGIKTRNLHVLSNDKENPSVELTIKASVTQKVAVEPDRLEYKLKGENAGAAEITVKSIDDQPFAITAMVATNDAVTADFNSTEKAKKFVIKTKLDPAKMAVSSVGRIEIKTTHPECPSIAVPFTVLARFRPDPPSINVINAELGKPVQKELWLLSNYDEDFGIFSVTSKEGTIKVVSQEKVGHRYKFNLEITPPGGKDMLRMFTDTLSISTKDGDKIDITCRGFFRLK